MPRPNTPVQYRPGKHFLPLDGLRGLAILVVLLAHFRLSENTNLIDHIVWSIAGFGVAGVDLFFVLSGFLITGILVDAKGGANYFISFYMRRTLRIFPLYYAYLIVMLLLLPFIRGLFHGLIHQTAPIVPHHAWFWLYGSNISEAIFPPYSDPGLGHLWSLAVEEQFYLVWPLVVLLANRKWLVRICIGMVLLAPAIRVVCWMLHYDMASVRLMPGRMDALALGGLIALAARNVEWTQRLRKHCGWLMATTSVLIFALILWRGTWEKLDVWVDTVGLSLVVVLAAALLTKVLAADPGPVTRLFTLPFLTNIGKYSYGIYVLHIITAHLIAPAIERHLHHLPLIFGSHILGQLVIFSILSTASYCLAWCSWHGFERWFLLLKDKFPYRDKAAA